MMKKIIGWTIIAGLVVSLIAFLYIQRGWFGIEALLISIGIGGLLLFAIYLIDPPTYGTSKRKSI